MSDREGPDAHETARVAIGLVLLAAAGAVGYWLFNAIVQLWEAPHEVPLVQFLADAVERNQVAVPEGETAWPESFGLIAGVFFAVLILYCVALVLKALIAGACRVLVPDLRPWAKRMTTEFARLREQQQDKRDGP